MLALGVYSGDDGDAAALAHDGRLLSAVSSNRHDLNDRSWRDVPYPVVVECLRAARVEAADIAQLVCVEPENGTGGMAGEPLMPGAAPNRAFRVLLGRLPSMCTTRVPSLLGHALQIRAVHSNASAVIIDRNRGSVARIAGGVVSDLRPIPGIEEMWCLAARLAAALGLDETDPLGQLEAVSSKAPTELYARITSCVQLSTDLHVTVDAEPLHQVLREAAERCPVPLDAHGSSHVELQHLRGTLAAALIERFAEIVGAIALQWSAVTDCPLQVFGGGAFAQPFFASRVAAKVPQSAFAPVAEGIGTAIGAALMPFASVQSIEHLALGARYDEQHIKNVLDNCRLDYVYEPDWDRLFDRVSGILETGALVGWFNGPADFGARSLGSRSVLCDPSKRYARENVNVFLLNRPEKDPIPVSVAPSARECLIDPSRQRFTYTDSEVCPTWRSALKSALDGATCRAHVPAAHPELTGLLDRHFARTKVPGLMNVPLGRLETPQAIDPRAAVRATFGSAIDVLAIGRFLVSKDYWLIRNH